MEYSISNNFTFGHFGTLINDRIRVLLAMTPAGQPSKDIQYGILPSFSEHIC